MFEVEKNTLKEEETSKNSANEILGKDGNSDMTVTSSLDGWETVGMQQLSKTRSSVNLMVNLL